MGGALEIGRVLPADWAEARDVRLRSLADAPDAFASSWAREEAFADDVWIERVSTGAWFHARAGGGVVGLACGIPEPTDRLERHLVGMWVAPVHRGGVVADRLVGAVEEWARSDGAARLTLWVVDGNERARRFYERTGFRATGHRQPLPTDRTVVECRMELDLDRPVTEIL